MSHSRSRCAVIALGGNAISPLSESDTVANQFKHTRESLSAIIAFAKRQYNLAITHGNGPQVGAALRRVELTRGEIPPIPLGVLVADTQGSMGYMIEQSLINRLATENLHRPVVSIITQVLVDQHDPALVNPTKYIGPVYTPEQARKFIADEGWVMKQYDAPERWRRVVGSPKPLGIVNRRAIRELVQSGMIIIAAGGGGIPVYRDPELGLEGVDAVIDKDRAAAILAHDIEAEEFIIMTAADAVYLDFGKPTQRKLSRLRVAEAKQYLAEGHFPEGSMGPKVEAAMKFVEGGGEKAIICALNEADKALSGESGTVFVP
jgi:carbamate kinase